MHKLIMTAMVCGISTSASAGFMTGSTLQSMCTKGQSYSLGYFAGAFDYSEIDSGRRLICMPKTVSVGQLRDVVCNYISENPHVRIWSGADVVRDAMIKAWPCAK